MPCILIDLVDIALYSGQIFKSATQLTPRDAELVAKVIDATNSILILVVRSQMLRELD